VKIQMLITILGTFHNVPGPKRGDVVEVDDIWARGYISSGYCIPVNGKPLALSDLPPGYRPG
jgi:hypothetical protein